MSHGAADAAGKKTVVLRLSVPAQGGMRAVACEFATRLAAFLGSNESAAAAVGSTLERLAERVAPDGEEGEIAFEFSGAEGELLIRARCNGRSSEVRCPLPA